MYNFIRKVEKGPYELELVVDSNLFNEDIILKAMYELVDKAYMFIKTDNGDYIVQFLLKPKVKDSLDEIVKLFSEELIYHKLRNELDKKYGSLREKIISTALGFSLNLNDVKSDLDKLLKAYSFLSSSNCGEQPKTEKSIEDIIEDIENDPDLDIDKKEIVNILREIDEESKDQKSI